LGGTCYDIDREQPSKGYPLSGDHIGRGLSGHEKKVTSKGTHFLETTEGEIGQDMERKKPSERHLPT